MSDKETARKLADEYSQYFTNKILGDLPELNWDQFLELCVYLYGEDDPEVVDFRSVLSEMEVFE